MAGEASLLIVAVIGGKKQGIIENEEAGNMFRREMPLYSEPLQVVKKLSREVEDTAEMSE